MLRDNRIPVKSAIFLISIMIIGLYISFGAIFSLSYIKDSPEDRKNVVKEFDSLFTFDRANFYEDSSFVKQSINMLNEINLKSDELHKFKMSSNFSKAKPSIRSRIDQIYDDAHDSLATHINKLSFQFELINSQLTDYKGQLYNLYTKGSSKFNIGASKLSSRLLNQFEREWISYVKGYETILATTINHNVSDLKGNGRILMANLLSGIRNSQILDTRLHEGDTTFEITPKTLIDPSFLPKFSSYEIDIADRTELKNLIEPEEGAIGEDWGVLFPWIIGFFAGSKNIDTLLVFGMLGFGLFGAGIAIFISGESLQRSSTGSHVLHMIVKGFSAAIVVYLAARGGIAVINKGVSDPDPLVLFLFCFIGAVFSDRIWAWARSRVSTSFADGSAPAPGPVVKPDEVKPGEKPDA